MSSNQQSIVHNARGAGRWFPVDQTELLSIVRGYTGDENHLPSFSNRIVAAISPHAGFIYSGRIAGITFRSLKDNASVPGFSPETVVIVGFPHRVPVTGVALLDGSAIVTPLGKAVLDEEGARLMVQASKIIHFDARPHAMEHSAENQVPFAQFAIPDSRMILAIMGDHSDETVNELVKALKALAAKKRVVVVASTDLLHDPDYDKVTRTDKATLKTITGLEDTRLLAKWSPTEQVCCGIGPVVTAMRFARSQGCPGGVLLQYRNSGDDFPESRGQWVVGYGAVVFPAGKER